METVRMAEANYPEGVRRVFLINGNFSIRMSNSNFVNNSKQLTTPNFSATDFCGRLCHGQTVPRTGHVS